MMACKNNGANTSSPTNSSKEVKPAVVTNDIIVGEKRKPSKPDFQVVDMSTEKDVLTVVFRYSGGCEDHSFNAHFSGAWLKSLPPKAQLHFEHLNPNNDSCRQLVKDTVRYDLTPLRYPAADKVMVQWMQGKGVEAIYEYGQ